MFEVDFIASIDELEQGLLARESIISVMRQQQAELLTTLDAMQVNQVDGARSMQEWVRGRLDVSSQTARDLVDAARQLPHQPELTELATDSGWSFERLVATSPLALMNRQSRIRLGLTSTESVACTVGIAGSVVAANVMCLLTGICIFKTASMALGAGSTVTFPVLSIASSPEPYRSELTCLVTSQVPESPSGNVWPIRWCR
jgi:hypothetical protein